MLPDVLDYNLDVVICGSAAGNYSATVGMYYAGPGNRFWPTLYKIGLTPRLMASENYRDVLKYGIGLTDLAKNKAGLDQILKPSDFDLVGLNAKIKKFAPRFLCFNGKKSAEVFLGRKTSFGLQVETIGSTKIYVALNTSGLNAHWHESVWQELADLIDKR